MSVGRRSTRSRRELRVRVRATKLGRSARQMTRGIREQGQAGDAAYRQAEALAALYVLLQPSRPLPPMRGYALSPDCGLFLAERVLAGSVHTAVELGSGVSTVLTALAFRQVGGDGHVTSYDHSPEWAARTQEVVDLHGLTDRVTIHVAPLGPVSETDLAHSPAWPRREGEVARWYALGDLPDGIDMALVDGPPAPTSVLARYPAMARLAPHLSPGAIVVLDDADRVAEREIVALWEREHPGLDVAWQPFEKGAAVCTWPG